MLTRTLRKIADRLYDWSDKINPGSHIEELEPIEDDREDYVFNEEEYHDQQKLEEVRDDPYSYKELIDYHKYKPKHFGKHKSNDREVPEQLIKDDTKRHGSSYGGEAELW